MQRVPLTSTKGQLYLGVFSGPVEGIIMIVIIYLISGIFGGSSALGLEAQLY